MNPYKLKDVFKYLTSNNQLLKKKLKLGTSEIPIPPKRQDVIDVEVINRFTKANPRVDTTNLKPLSVKQSNVKKPDEAMVQGVVSQPVRTVDPERDSFKKISNVIGAYNRYRRGKKNPRLNFNKFFELYSTENFAEGGRIGYKDGPKLTDFLNVQASGSKTGKNQIQGAPEGITSDKEIINAIITMDIPLTEKVNLIGDLQYGKFRDKIEYKDDEIYLDDPKSYRNRNIGLEYNRGGEGFSGSATVGDEGPEYNIRYKKSFADGGMLVQPNEDGSRPGYSGKYGPNIRKLTQSDTLEVQIIRGGTGGGKGGQKFYKTFNFEDYGSEENALKAAKEYRESIPKIKKDTGKQSKGLPIGFKKETGGQSEIRKILKEIIEVGGKSFSNEDIRQLIDTDLFPDDDQFRKAVDVVKKEPEFKNLTFEKKPRPRLKNDPVSVLMAKTKERRNKKINILGSKDYEKELYKYKKEIQEALGLEKYKTSGSISGKPREILPIEMGHQSSIKQLSLLKQKMRPEDLSPQNYQVNRKGVKKNKGGVQTLEDNLNKKFYPEQKKLYIQAKKFIDAGKTVPADLQNKIVSLNEDIQKFVDNTVKKYPLLKDRVNPITIDANDLTVKRGNNVFKQLGIGLVDQNLGDIKIGSIDDLTIKANLAQQTFKEAVDAGLIDEIEGQKKLNKFLNSRPILRDAMTKTILKNIQGYSKLPQCKVGAADGGRIGFAYSDECLRDGLKEQKIEAQKGNKKAAQELVQVGKVATRAGLLRNLLGPGAILGEAVYEGAVIANKVLGGTPADIAWAESYLSYLDPRKYTPEGLDPLEMRREDMITREDFNDPDYAEGESKTIDGPNANILRSGFAAQDQVSAFNEAINEKLRGERAGRFDIANRAAADVREQGRFVDQSKDIISSDAFQEATKQAQEYIQGQTGENMAKYRLGDFGKYESGQDRDLRREREKEMKDLYRQYSDQELISMLENAGYDSQDVVNQKTTTRITPAVTSTLTALDQLRTSFQKQDAMENLMGGTANFAGGGIASLTKTIPPESGPTPQGLPYVYNNVKKI